MLSKKSKNNFIYSAPAVILIVVIAFAVLHGTISAYEKMKASKERRVLAETELADLSKRHGEINDRVTYLETEKGLEEAVRTKYNVAQEGEEVFVIIDNDVKEEVEVEKRSVWTILKMKVANIFR